MQIRTKAEWRTYALQRREAQTAEERKAKSEQICGRMVHSRLVAAIQEHTPRPTVLVYWPFRSEVDIRPFITWAWQQSWIVAAPRVDREQAVMHFFRIGGPSDLKPGAYGIMEPGPDQPLLDDEGAADLIIMPGAAFDRRGNRIGYGGGYYDKKMEQWMQAGQQPDKLPLRLAPAFDLQLFARLPAEDHDIAVDVIVTEKEEIYTSE